MTRKKQRNNPPGNPAAATPPPSNATSGNATLVDATSGHAEPELPAEAAIPAEPLMEEVQSFLSKRAELAQKLADEIEATEKKLADLRKTAALLFPENATNGAKDRKPKKVKMRVANREEKAEPKPAAESSPPAEAPGA